MDPRPPGAWSLRRPGLGGVGDAVWLRARRFFFWFEPGVAQTGPYVAAPEREGRDFWRKESPNIRTATSEVAELDPFAVFVVFPFWKDQWCSVGNIARESNAGSATHCAALRNEVFGAAHLLVVFLSAQLSGIGAGPSLSKLGSPRIGASLRLRLKTPFSLCFKMGAVFQPSPLEAEEMSAAFERSRPGWACMYLAKLGQKRMSRLCAKHRETHSALHFPMGFAKAVFVASGKTIWPEQLS